MTPVCTQRASVASGGCEVPLIYSHSQLIHRITAMVCMFEGSGSKCHCNCISLLAFSPVPILCSGVSGMLMLNTLDYPIWSKARNEAPTFVTHEPSYFTNQGSTTIKLRRGEPPPPLLACHIYVAPQWPTSVISSGLRNLRNGMLPHYQP